MFTTPHPNHCHVRSSLTPNYVHCPSSFLFQWYSPILPVLESSPNQAFLLPFPFTLMLLHVGGGGAGSIFSKNFSDLVSSMVKQKIKPNASLNYTRFSMLGPQPPFRILSPPDPTVPPAYTSDPRAPHCLSMSVAFHLCLSNLPFTRDDLSAPCLVLV